MNAEAFEAFLARIYTDRRFREAFLRRTLPISQLQGLSPAQVRALLEIDEDGLKLMAESLARSRGARRAPGFMRALLERFADRS